MPQRYAVRDTRLEGLWRSDTKLWPTYCYISYGPTAQGSFLYFGKDENGRPYTISLDFFVIRTAKHAYLNINVGSAKVTTLGTHLRSVRQEPSQVYTFAEYHFSWNGKLVVSDIGGEFFSRAVQQGKLRGKVDLFFTMVRHERPGRLLNFIESAKPGDVFVKPAATATKIGPP